MGASQGENKKTRLKRYQYSIFIKHFGRAAIGLLLLPVHMQTDGRLKTVGLQ